MTSSTHQCSPFSVMWKPKMWNPLSSGICPSGSVNYACYLFVFCHIPCPPFSSLQMTFPRLMDIGALGERLPWPPSRASNAAAPSIMSTHSYNPRKEGSGGNWGLFHTPLSIYRGGEYFQDVLCQFPHTSNWLNLVRWPMLAAKEAEKVKSGLPKFDCRQRAKGLGMTVR